MRAAAFLFLLLCPGAAFAQQKTPAAALNPNSEKPLEITADQTLEWHRNDLKYIARGNVVAKQGNAVIKADLLVADYRPAKSQTKKSGSEIYRLTATGHVVISSDNNAASGDKAVYDVDKGVAVMTGGNLRMNAQDQIVTARDNFEYDVAAGKLTANGGARAVKKTDKGEDAITSDTLSAWLAQDETGKRTVSRLTADQHVVITTPTEIMRGDRGDYNARTRIATVTGHVRLERGPNILEGDRAEINLATNVSRMLGVNGKGGRVRGVFYPSGDLLSVSGTGKSPSVEQAAPAAGQLP
jgi:lipopolysaccharide export system protein LptA